METFTEMGRRRVADFDLEDEIENRTRHTLDLFEVIAPPSWQGPVVLRNEVLAMFMAGDSLQGGVLQTPWFSSLQICKNLSLGNWKVRVPR